VSLTVLLGGARLAGAESDYIELLSLQRFFGDTGGALIGGMR